MQLGPLLEIGKVGWLQAILQVHHHLFAALQVLDRAPNVVGGDQKDPEHEEACRHGDDGGERQSAMTLDASGAFQSEIAQRPRLHFTPRSGSTQSSTIVPRSTRT